MVRLTCGSADSVSFSEVTAWLSVTAGALEGQEEARLRIELILLWENL